MLYGLSGPTRGAGIRSARVVFRSFAFIYVISGRAGISGVVGMKSGAAFSLWRVIPIHEFRVFDVWNSFILNDFPEVTPNWKRIEMPRGCVVKLPIVFTYPLS